MADAVGRLLEQLEQLRQEAVAAARAASDSSALEAMRVHYLGKKGALTAILKALGGLSAEQRPQVGAVVNLLKQELTSAIEERHKVLDTAERRAKLESQRLDLGLSGRRPQALGGLHPLQQALEEITAIFTGMGFSVAEGPEIEDEFHNFDALNIPPEHPARAMHDTFFVSGKDGLLLRTHTSPVQIRSMLAATPPLAIVAPGRVYRCDHDVTHSPMFHQVEVFLVDREVSMAHLKGVLQHFLNTYFGRDLPMRLRPSFFPFTEPSAEVDIGCVLCGGDGCRVCKESGWLEVLGAGMIHPNVLRAARIDADEYSGFAFGLGVERLAMLKYGIPDLRLFYENDLRFLTGFAR